MSDIKFHWFKDSSKNVFYAVVAGDSHVISPVRLRDHFKFDPLYAHILHDIACESEEGLQVHMLVDSSVDLPEDVQSLLEHVAPEIRDKIANVVLIGHHSVAEAFEAVNSYDDHDFMRRRLGSMMSKLHELAPLDSTGRKLLMLKGRRHLMDRDFFTVIENDAALSAQLMNWSCSAMYGGYSEPAKNLQDAVRRSLGIEQALILSIGLSIQKSFKIEKQLKSYLDDYIRRSVYVASVSKQISMVTSISHDADTIYLCGMLHNLGELILMQANPGLYRLYVAYMQVNPGHYPEYVQRHVLKMSCAEIGVTLGEQWELPTTILDVMHHGRPNELTEEATGEDRIVALAQGMLARRLLIKGHSEIDYREKKYRLGLEMDNLFEVRDMFYSQKSYLDAIITSIAH